jgi:hypothetical protein
MLRRKNKLMRSGHIAKAEALSAKIGAAIKRYNSVEMSPVDHVADARTMWTKVRQITGHEQTSLDNQATSSITAESLSHHYASIHIYRLYIPRPTKKGNNAGKILPYFGMAYVSDFGLFTTNRSRS